MFEIHSVTINNFRSYKGEHQFFFPKEPGLYCLTGENEENPRLGANGTGKSSLLDAIHWCLYGRTSRGLKAGDVVTWGEKSCSVMVMLYIHGKRYCIERCQSPNSLKAITDDGQRDVTQDELDKHLRLTAEAFTSAVMIPQFGKSFFELKPAEKLTLFSDIMGLEYWLAKSKEAADIVAAVATSLAKLSNSIAKTQGGIEATVADIAALKKEQETFDEDKEATLKALTEELRLLHKRDKPLQAEVKDAEKVLASAEAKLTAHQLKELELCKECKQPLPDKGHEAKTQALQRNCTDFRRVINNLNGHISANEHAIDRLNASIARESAAKDPYAVMLQTKEKLLTGSRQQLAKHEIDKKALEQEHEETSYWVSGFKRIRLIIIEEALSQLEVEVNNSLEGLGLVDWIVKFETETENKSGGTTKGFLVLIYPPGASEPVKFESYCGGETQRLCLAGDFGLANLIMERAGLTSSIEFYDEPSSHLSPEGMIDLADTLYQRAHLTGRAVWIVDHKMPDMGNGGFAFAGTLLTIKGREGTRLSYLG